MSTPSLEYLSSVWQYLPQGHEKALKQAFYNTVANIFVVIAALVAVTVYFILAPFIRPLYWAVLCGTFLYPFKRSLTNLLRQWLKGLNNSGTPFALGLVILPLQIGNFVAESITSIIWSNIKLVLGLFIGIPSIYWVYYFTPLRSAFPVIMIMLGWLYEFLEYFSSAWVWTLFLAYLISVAVLWKPMPSLQPWLRFLSAPIWVSLLLHFASAAGPLRVPLFILMISVMIIGAVVQISPQSSEHADNEPVKTCCLPNQNATCAPPTQEIDATTSKKESTALLDESPVIIAPSTSVASTSTAKDKQSLEIKSSEMKSLETQETSKLQTLQIHSSDSTAVKPSSLFLTETETRKKQEEKIPPTATISMVDQCFMGLFWGHVIVRIWMHVWLILLLLFLPILHVVLKKIFQQFGEGGLFQSTAVNAKSAIHQWLLVRHDVLMPHCLRGLGSLLLKGDQKIIMILEQGLDQATSILFILMMLIGTVLISVIGAVQIQRESMYMITSVQSLMNKTMNSEFSDLLPNAEMMKKTMDQVLHKTHEHGRNFIASKVKDILPVDQSSEETENIINQVLEVWDKLYETMLLHEQSTNMSALSKSGFENITSMSTLWQTISSGKGMFQLMGVVEFVKEHLDTFMSVWESVWTVLRSNMNLFFTVVTTILSALLGGGTAILNFVISAIIFLTTLFYLLASSGDMYKPAELFSNMSPGSAGSKFGTAVECAISGVFKASLKMATFYGLYTWLIHIIFGLDIVFIPSAMAACFAAVPFLGPYWAALPAVIELWLVQDDGLSAILLFVAHLAPAYFVDTAIYREIDGSHPYVTGLSIAGGMLFMGLEGALIGPIILCCLIVVLKMYSTMLQNEPGTPNPALQNMGLHSFLSRAQLRNEYAGSRSVSSSAINVHKTKSY